MKLSDIINLERVKIEKETNSYYQVRYRDEIYRISKSDESSFIINGNNSITPEMEMSLEPRLELIVAQDTEIFQDASVPKRYREVMMFHEIREIEYQEAGFEDAHERAVNDEVLYVLKFFDKKTRDAYIKWSKEYRDLKLRESKSAEVEEENHKTEEIELEEKTEKIDEEPRALFVLRYGIDRYDSDFCAYVITTDQNIHDKLQHKLQSAYQVGFRGTIFGSGFEHTLSMYLAHFQPILVVDQDHSYLPSFSFFDREKIHFIEYDQNNIEEKIDYVFSLLKQLHEQSGKE